MRVHRTRYCTGYEGSPNALTNMHYSYINGKMNRRQSARVQYLVVPILAELLLSASLFLAASEANLSPLELRFKAALAPVAADDLLMSRMDLVRCCSAAPLTLALQRRLTPDTLR